MNLEDFPKNNKITDLRNKILELEKINDWNKIMYAKSELYDLVNERKKWAEENNIY